MSIKQWVASMTLKRALWILGGIAIVLGVFKAGEFVGFGKAEYSYRWGASYYRGFMGPRGGFDGPGGMMGGRFGGNYLLGHGLSGTVLSVASSTFVMQDRDGAEKVVAVSSSTAVRMYHGVFPYEELSPGMFVMVIGAPNDAGVVDARLVRVMPMQLPAVSTSSTWY